MQCKDVPTIPILQFLKKHKGMWCSLFNGGPLPWIFDAMPKNIPWNLKLAKMNKLIRKGHVSGCACGCRGDFEITEKGEQKLNSSLIKENLTEILYSACEEHLRHGYDSVFSIRLSEIIRKYGLDETLGGLDDIFLNDKLVSIDVIGYSMRWISSTMASRNDKNLVNMYKRYLVSEELELRDAAAIAIELSASTDMLPDLKIALEAEKVEFLRDYIEIIIGYLEREN